jgi:hypothetical protein
MRPFSSGRRRKDARIQAILGGMVCFFLLALLCCGAGARPEYSPLTIGSRAPAFCLPGTDGKRHCLEDYAASKVLVIAFICDHCPTSQLYESRIKRLLTDYQARGVALVAIQPNNPDAVRLDEMGYTYVGDSLAEMKICARFRQFNFPYLYDGENQKVSAAYGPSATPHLFIFDSQRRLRYQGRVDNNIREPLVTKHDARDAIDAVLAGKTVAVAKTPSVGCSQMDLQRSRTSRGDEGDREKTCQPASDRCRRSEGASQQRHRKAAFGGLLGNLVRAVPAGNA